MIWCDKCSDYGDFEITKEEKGKTGLYYPYRDTMESEQYTYTERTVKCIKCGNIQIEKIDQVNHMSESDMEKYGYNGANYGT